MYKARSLSVLEVPQSILIQSYSTLQKSIYQKGRHILAHCYFLPRLSIPFQESPSSYGILQCESESLLSKSTTTSSMDRRLSVPSHPVNFAIEADQIEPDYNRCYTTEKDRHCQYRSAHIVTRLVAIREQIRGVKVRCTTAHKIHDSQRSSSLRTRARDRGGHPGVIDIVDTD